MYCCTCGITPKCPFGSLSSNGFLEYKTSKKCSVEEHIIDLSDLPIFPAFSFVSDPNYYTTDRMYFCLNQRNAFGDIFILGTKSVGQTYDALCCTGGNCEYAKSEKECHEKNDTSWVFTHESQKRETAFLRSSLDVKYSDKTWYLDNYGPDASLRNPPVAGDPFGVTSNIHPVLEKNMDEAIPFPHQDPYNALSRFHRGIIDFGLVEGSNAITVSERHCELYDTTDPWYKKIRIFTFATPSGCGNCFDCSGIDKCNHCELPFCANGGSPIYGDYCDISRLTSAVTEAATPCGEWSESVDEKDCYWSMKLRCTASCKATNSIHCFSEGQVYSTLCNTDECGKIEDLGIQILGQSYHVFGENYKHGNFDQNGEWLDCAPGNGSYDAKADEDEEEDGRCCIGDGSFIVCLDKNNLPISDPNRPPITTVTASVCMSEGYRTIFNPDEPIKGHWSQHGLCDSNPCYTNCTGTCDNCSGTNCSGVCVGGTAFKTKKCPAYKTTGTNIITGITGCSPFGGIDSGGIPIFDAEKCLCRIEDNGISSNTPDINLFGNLYYLQTWTEWIEEIHAEYALCGTGIRSPDCCPIVPCYDKNGNPTCDPGCPSYWDWASFKEIQPTCCSPTLPCNCLLSTDCCGDCSPCDIINNGCQGFNCCGRPIPGTSCPEDCPEQAGEFGCDFGGRPCSCPCPPPCSCDTDCNCNGGEFGCCDTPICTPTTTGCPCPEPEPCICDCSGDCCCRTSATGYCGDCEGGCGSGKKFLALL
jgi:hypothetical protein